MPLSKSLNRVAGKLEEATHEGFVLSGVLRKLNSKTAKYPKLSNEEKAELRAEYFSDDEIVKELYSQ